MSPLRLSLAWTVILMLLGGLGTAVEAQADETATSRVVSFTGARLDHSADFEQGYSVDDGVWHGHDSRQHDVVAWSDVRLPTDMLSSMNYDVYDIGEFSQKAITGTLLLEGPDGYWAGTFTGFCDQAGDCYGMNIVTGYGDYAGLSAIFRGSPNQDSESETDFTWQGLIFEGEMPPMPDPIEPATE